MEQKGKKPIAKHEYEYSPVTLSIQTAGSISTPLIRRGTPLPYDTTQVFSTAADNQESIEINILLGERPLAKYNISIGKCLLNVLADHTGNTGLRILASSFSI